MKLFWRRVDHPLRRPLKVGRRVLHERAVMELELRDDQGRVMRGEAAPLPGLHSEDLGALPYLLPAALALLRDRFRPDSLTIDPQELRTPWLALPPSLRCGLEGALLDHVGLRTAWLAEGVTPPPSAALLDGGGLDLTSGLTRAACVKVKVGRREQAVEIDTVHRLRVALGDDAEIRLDANRAFALDEALDFAAAVSAAGPVWIEEPVRDPATLPTFIESARLPVALDETLHEAAWAPLLNHPGIAAWVVKPALLGVAGTLALFRRAELAPSRPCCVVSSSFEGRTGMALLELLARQAPGRPAPGLGTAPWLGAPRHGPWSEVHAEP